MGEGPSRITEAGTSGGGAAAANGAVVRRMTTGGALRDIDFVPGKGEATLRGCRANTQKNLALVSK